MALSQRENCRWHLLEMKLHHVEEKWENCLEEVGEEIYGLFLAGCPREKVQAFNRHLRS